MSAGWWGDEGEDVWVDEDNEDKGNVGGGAGEGVWARVCGLHHGRSDTSRERVSL